MTQLVIDGKRQSVTTLVSYKDKAGDLFLILTRPDPRYRDREGKCLNGVRLPVGPCKFVGGVVEEETLSRIPDALKIKKPSDMDLRIPAAALLEIEQEINLDTTAFIKPDGQMRLIETLTRDDGRGRIQDVHYFLLHLGTLDQGETELLHAVVKPADDLIETIIQKATELNVDAAGQPTVTPAKGTYRIKTEFTGFPEIEAWNREYDAHADNPALVAEKAVYNRMHTELRGLQGIDLATIDPKSSVEMYKPPSGETGDAQILKHLLQLGFDFTLTPTEITPVLSPQEEALLQTVARKSEAHRHAHFEMPEEEWIKKYGSGTLRRIFRQAQEPGADMDYKTRYIAERVKFSYGEGFEAVFESRVTLGTFDAQPSSMPHTETLWHSDAFNLRDTFGDRANPRAVRVEYDETKVKDGLGIVLTLAQRPKWLPAGRTVLAMTSVKNPATGAYSHALNPN